MSLLVDLFLPHHGNNHKARLARTSSLFVLAGVFILFQVLLSFFLVAKPAVLGFSSSIAPENIIELTNNERTKKGLVPLKENKLLSEAARQKASDMFAFNYWAHVSPSGRTPWTFFNDVGYKYQYAGENLARDFRDSESVVSAWMNSPSHKENIINPKYEEIGIAVVDGSLQGVETTLVVQYFGTIYSGTLSKPKVEVNEKPVVVAEKPAGLLEVKVNATNEVLSNNLTKTIPITNPLDLTKAVIILIVGILIGVFTADILLVSHKQTPRFSSKSLAQLMFLLFVLLISMFIKQGAIF